MKVRIKRLHENATIPSYGTEHAAGMDMTAVSKEVVTERGFQYIEYKTGIAIEIPEGHVGLIYPRSSISKTKLSLANSVGVIDADYRGEISFRFQSDSDLTHHEYWPQGAVYNVGDRIGQLIIIPYPKVEFEEVSELTETERGTGGYGSTGK